MRQRTTFIHKPGHGIDPAALEITDRDITGPPLTSVREDRLTFALDELPKELQTVLSQAHELHIRWSSSSPSSTVAPLLSRTPPGLHVFYTPLDAQGAESDTICSLLRTLFGDIDCVSPKESFTSLDQGRFPHSSAFQYYQQLEKEGTLASFSEYVAGSLCRADDTACIEEVNDRLAAPAAIDISYDAISHALKATVVSRYDEHDEQETQDMRVTSTHGHRTEVGILTEDKPPTLEPEELGVSGILTVLGQDSKPSPVLFSFPSRHRHAEGTFTTELLQPTGLHPTLQLSITSQHPPLEDTYCSPHAYFTLPRWIFPDKYQLSDDLFLASKNLTALRYVSQPVDLEAPDYVMKLWGSAVLLELSPPTGAGDETWTAEVPLHLRYLLPVEGGYQERSIPYPAVFWACNAEEGTKFPTNPFDRVNLGYDGLFGPRTVFWHVDPSLNATATRNAITIPVLDVGKAGWVNAGTAAAVLLGFSWVLWKLLVGYSQVTRKSQATTQAAVVEDKKRI